MIYEVYIRSFADANGDGVGDVAGIRSRLPYLADLGVDAIWITPWYPSPMVDGGYDVADYRDVDPRLGTLAEADSLLADAHARGLRVILDLVPNHTSSRHPWFTEALAARGPARDRYIFRDGRGPDGAEPPNDWQSVFGGPAWTRVREADGRPGQWYLHLFDVEQPDLNWTNAEVQDGFDAILRFWFDRGVDGFRIDVAQGLAKDPALPDLGPAAAATRVAPADPGHPYWDLDGSHDIFRRWRAVADTYDGDRLFVAEAVVAGPERRMRYVRPGELHTAFNFDLLRSPWDPAALRTVIDSEVGVLSRVGAPPSWVLSSQDEARHLTRYGRVDSSGPVDRELGTRRARAAALLMLGLPGSAYVYQGEELGLDEVEDIPEELLQDPAWKRSGHTVRGRDGARVPLPWSGDAPPFGFGPPGSTPWLPQPARWRRLTADRQRTDPASMLALYRSALRLRRDHPGFAGEALRWLEAPSGVLLFEREAGLRCAVNLSGRPYRLPTGARVLLASEPAGEREHLQSDTAAWWQP